MIELNVYISGDSNSQEFRVKLAEIRTFIMEKLANEDVIGLEIRAFDTTRTRYSPAPPLSRINYNSPNIRKPTSLIVDQVPTDEPTFTLNEIIISSRSEALMVLQRLGEVIENYEVATVSDFKELVGLPSVHVDAKWGWINLAGVEVRQVREGFVIDLPTPELVK